MRTRVIILFALLLLTKAAHAQSEDKYICTANKAVGFNYTKTKGWYSSNFSPDNKYVLAKSGSKYKTAYELTKIGENVALGFCKNDFNKQGFLFCNTTGGPYAFNSNTGRYTLSYYAGYYNVKPEDIGTQNENNNTPMLEIGTCSPF